MSCIYVKGLSKSFEYYEKEAGLRNSVRKFFNREKLYKQAVDNVSFEIGKGDIVGFLGANGAGKTTTLKMLSGILYPTGGEATVMGYVPWERKNEFKKKFSIIMGQKNQLWWDLPANESLYLNKCIYEIDDAEYRKTLEYLMELMNVKHVMNIQVRRLSLGERMKLEIIAALLHRPEVIFLDEPTIGLDIISQKNVREFLKQYNRQTKATIILTSHYLKDIQDLCRRSIIINKGRVIYDGQLEGVNTMFAEKMLLKLQLSEYSEKECFEGMGAVKDYDGFNVTLEVEKKDVGELSRVIMESFQITDLNIEDVPLEEGIERLYMSDTQNNNEVKGVVL